MNRNDYISNFYNEISSSYVKKFSDELNYKHFDQMLLKTFAMECDGKVLDIACGPGHTTGFLNDIGVKNIQGVDLSLKMVESARSNFKNITFDTADMCDFHFKNGEFDHAVCFYGIVHFNLEELSIALLEINRILKPGGNFLFSFHIGNDTIHFDEFYGHKVDIKFQLFEKKDVIELSRSVGFEIVDVLERNPYPGIESETQRAYIWVRK